MRDLMQILALLLCSGCFLISDTDRFEMDQSCDLQLRLRNFRPHTDDLFEVSAIQNGPAGAELLTTAIFEPLESETLNLRMPNGIPPLATPDRELAFLTFFGDDDSTPGYSFPGDHSWILEDACTSGPEVFPHDIIFQELPEVENEPTTVVVSLCDVTGGLPLEVRVYGDLQVGGAVEERRATALYRFTMNTRGDVTRDLRIPAIVDRGFDHFIDIYIDANSNGAYDAGETAWRFDFEPDPATPSCALLELLPGEVDPCVDRDLPAMFSRFSTCTDGDFVRVTLGRLGNRNRLMPGETLPSFSPPDEPNSWLNFDPADDGE